MLQQAARRDAGLKLLALAREATLAAEAILRDATAAVRARVRVERHTVERLFDREQRATHGLAWLATYVEGIRQVTAFAERAHARRHAGRGQGAAGRRSGSANSWRRSWAAFR